MPAPIAIPLTAAERRALWRIRLNARSPRLWARATALIMLSMGELGSHVADVLSVSINTITNWKRRWLQGGCFRLEDAPHTGRPTKATKRYLELLKEAVERGPRAYSYLFTVWSTARLAAHMGRKTHISLSSKRIRVWLKRLGFVFRRPKHTLRSRQNRRKFHAAKARLKALKKGLSASLRATNCGSKTKGTSIFILI